MREFARRKPTTTLGASLTVSMPTGEYRSDKLINVGNNRWAIKPELGLSHPIGPWYLEAYAGLWLFGDNDDFLSGQRRAQDPLASFPAVELARRHDILPADREKSVAQIQLERGRLNAGRE
ncbi:MAG TPA: transporter [Steroidobacteraceae bacterium]